MGGGDRGEDGGRRDREGEHQESDRPERLESTHSS
jgi:hypothetical protein